MTVTTSPRVSLILIRGSPIARVANKAPRGSTIRRWTTTALLLLVRIGVAHAESSAANPQPTADMLEPVRALVAFMSAPRAADPPRVFAPQGLCIVENFAPYLFCDPHAAQDWERAYRAQSVGETELAARFDAARDFSAANDRAYFSLPTTWTGVLNGRHFEEHGAWAFVLQRVDGKWLVLGYAWGITGRTESSAP